MKALLFDLDDTLYSERDFVASGFRAVARYIAMGCRSDDVQVFQHMMNMLVTQGRRKVLPGILGKYLGSSVPLAELVRVYRDHEPRICLFPGYAELLKRLRRRFTLGLITDGLPAVQRRKIAALGVEGLFDRIVCTWDHGEERQKPHPHSFLLMLRRLGVDAGEAAYIGDNEQKDGEGARRVGMCFIHTCGLSDRAPARGTARAGVPGFHVDTLHQMPELLASLN